MQRLQANNWWADAFPAILQIGFVAEPLATKICTFKITRQIIGNQLSAGSCMTEQLMPALLAGTEYDLSRHVDVRLMVVISVLIVPFPGGSKNLMFGEHLACAT